MRVMVLSALQIICVKSDVKTAKATTGIPPLFVVYFAILFISVFSGAVRLVLRLFLNLLSSNPLSLNEHRSSASRGPVSTKITGTFPLIQEGVPSLLVTFSAVFVVPGYLSLLTAKVVQEQTVLILSVCGMYVRLRPVPMETAMVKLDIQYI